MAKDFDFRILINTISGSTLSYGTGSFARIEDGTTFTVLSTSESWARVDNMRSMSYYNSPGFTTQSLYKTDARTFKNTNIDGTSTDYRYISCSIDNTLSGSISFIAFNTPT